MTSIIDLFNNSVATYSDNSFLWEKRTTKFEPTTYQQTKTIVTELAAGLITLGVQKGDKIALLSEGRNAWIIGELTILHTGAVNVPLSIKLEESNDLMFRIQHSECTYIIVSEGQLPKIRNIIGELPHIKNVICFDDVSLQQGEITWSSVQEFGKKALSENPQLVNDRTQKVTPNDLANIVYTSGTTADPKGIMLTHRNYTANVEQALTLMNIPPYFRTLIILPLDHCFAHVAGFYSFMASGASVGTVQNGKTGIETIKNIPLNINELKPHLLLSVPALAKNFKKNIEAGIRKKGKFINNLFHFAIKMAYRYNKEGHNKGRGVQQLKKPLLNLFDKILFQKIREGFGGNLQFFIGGGALLDIELQRFFYAIGIPMYQGYGLSEATPIISSNGEKKHKLGSSGWLVSPMEIKICNEEGKTLPSMEKGEIVIKGENVMAGYWNNPTATAQTVKNGWLHTGDMGYLDNDRYLYVVGRFKSLLIGVDGEKYSPEGIEEALSDHSRFIDQVILHNNQHPHTSALIVPNKELLKNYIKRKKTNLSWETTEAKQIAINKLQREINSHKKGGINEGKFPERWIPSTFAILSEPFTEQNGLVNSTMKIVRGKVEKRYQDRIEEMYTPEGKNPTRESNIKALS